MILKNKIKHNSRTCSFFYSSSSGMSLLTLDSLWSLNSIWVPSFFQENLHPRSNFFVLVDNMHLSAEKESKKDEKSAHNLQVFASPMCFFKNVLNCFIYLWIIKLKYFGTCTVGHTNKLSDTTECFYGINQFI